MPENAERDAACGAETLLVLAASARALVERLADAGLARIRGGRYRLCAVDAFADLDTRRASEACARYPAAPLEASAILAAVDAVSAPAGPGRTTVLLGGGLEPVYPELLPALRRRGRVLGPTARAVRLLADPLALRQRLASVAVRLPQAVTDRTPPTGRWLVKDRLRAGGGAVRPARSGAALPPGCFAERVVEGNAGSLCGFVDGADAVVIGAARHRRLPAHREAPRFARTALIAWPEAPHEAARDVLAGIGDRFAHRGIVGVDVIVEADGTLTVIDINLRPPASLDLFPGVDGFLRAWLDAQRPSDLPVREAGPLRGTAVVYAPRTFTLSAAAQAALMDRARTATNERETTADGAWVHDLPAPGMRFARGEPVCTVSCRAASGEEAEAALEARMRWVIDRVVGPIHRSASPRAIAAAPEE